MTKDLSHMNLSFAGCGFLCIYHAGVCAAIKEYAPELTRNKISGASAGAIAAAGLICNVCMSQATSTILHMVSQARSGSLQALTPTFNVMEHVKQGLNDALPPDAHILCSGKLFISLTRARDYKNVTVSEYASRDELMRAIMCSCFIPFYCGRNPPVYRGEAYIDGGFSNNQPVIDIHTISVSPFSGESDICPSDVDSASFLGFNFYGTAIQFSTQNLFRMFVTLFPPSQEICSRICRQGFDDTLRFLIKNGLSPCARCLTVQSNALPLSQYAKQNPHRKTSIMSFNGQRPRFLDIPQAKRHVDECGRCFEKVEQHSRPQFSNIPLPHPVQQTLDDAAAAENQIMKYFRSYRVFRWALRFMTPVILPMRSWVTRASTPDFYLARLQKLIDFILVQIDNKRLLYEPSKVSCKIAITEFDERLTKSFGSWLDICTVDLPFQSGVPNLRNEQTVLEEEENEEVPSTPLPSTSGGVPDLVQIDDEDVISELVDYSKNRDAVFCYYYPDDEDPSKVKVCEIFDMQNPTTSHNCHSNTCPNSRTNSLRPSQFFAQLSAMSAVGEEDENSQLRRTQSEKTNADTPSFEISHSKTCPPMHTVDENEEHNNAEQNEYQKSEVRMLENIFQGGNENEEDHTKEDSGYSLTDDSTKGGTKEKRDACCSPVHEAHMTESSTKSKLPAPSSRKASYANQRATSSKMYSDPSKSDQKINRRHTFSGARGRNIRSINRAGSDHQSHGQVGISRKTAYGRQNDPTSSSQSDDEMFFVPTKSSGLMESGVSNGKIPTESSKIPTPIRRKYSQR
ncbi:patatin-like phospholipase domain-containing protein [Ditylenchus destructor]|uniref:triacylglycerol lipase n=1 Tax=Ditylenchus destructor TaxID=166010 RepID=A0AAD4RCE2_9BILA|nr:patatin-like phospholipase domain-containing protein [Ditylenchus destructor]